MAKFKTTYACTECGGISTKWTGQCSDCGNWNTLTEVVVRKSQGSSRLSINEQKHAGYAGGARSEIVLMSEVPLSKQVRISSGLNELDRVLGGGLVPGSVILLGGDPGIGKSTVLLQSLNYLSKQNSSLYVTGEESLQQVKLRAERLGLVSDNIVTSESSKNVALKDSIAVSSDSEEIEHNKPAKKKNSQSKEKIREIQLLIETNIETILNLAMINQPQIMVIDSIQTMHTSLLDSAPGSVGQLREGTAQLVQFAKTTGTILFLVGHVTKEGTLAGPRVLEHMVDTVLYFESTNDSRYRLLRAVKNRFGAVNEIGVFAMSDKGLLPVTNPSAIFLSGNANVNSGSAVMVTWEGSRPLLVEIQALVSESHLANPRRVVVGFDPNRLALMLAVLSRHGGVATYDQDVFINVVGGMRITETAVDLPVLLAVLSSLKNRALPKGLVVFGEIGLAGEIRPVQNGQERLKEALKLGFSQAIVPYANKPKKAIEGMQITAVKHVSEALQFL